MVLKDKGNVKNDTTQKTGLTEAGRAGFISSYRFFR